MADTPAKIETPGAAQPSHLDFSKISKGTRVSISLGALAALSVGLYFGHDWLAGHLVVKLMSKAEAQELTQQVKDATEAANAAAVVAAGASMQLSIYIETQQLREHREQLAQLEDQLADTLLWESENGENEVSRARKSDLRIRIGARARYIQCLERDRPGEDCEL